MSTRHAKPGSPLKQSRYCSSPELETGLRANLVAMRCSVLDSTEDRELIWSLQQRSNDEGLKQFVSDFLTRFANRIGTKSMIECGVKPGKRCNAEQVKSIRPEIKGDACFPLRGEMEAPGILEMLWDRKESQSELAERRAEAASHPLSYAADEFISECQAAATKLLEDEVKKLCLDPAVSLEQGPWYFHDLIACLREYLAGSVERRLTEFGFAHTKLSRTIWREIDDVHEMGGTVLLHNSAGNGKSFAADALCEAYPGRARYVLTPATNDETTFMRAIANGLSVCSGLSWTVVQLRERITKVLLTGDLVLVLDNAQYCFPVSDYRYALPNRMNWILDMAERGVPIVMIAHSKVFDTLGFVEARTGWSRATFVSQVRLVEIPAGLEVEDVQTVAAALLPDGERGAQRKLADYMIAAPGYLHSGSPAAKRARRIAAEQRRARVTLADMEAALDSWMVPSLKAMESALKRADAAGSKCKSTVRNWRPDTAAQVAAKAGKKRNQIVTSSDLKPQPLKRSETPVNPDFNDAEETQFPGSRNSRLSAPDTATPAELVTA